MDCYTISNVNYDYYHNLENITINIYEQFQKDINDITNFIYENFPEDKEYLDTHGIGFVDGVDINIIKQCDDIVALIFAMSPNKHHILSKNVHHMNVCGNGFVNIDKDVYIYNLCVKKLMRNKGLASSVIKYTEHLSHIQKRENIYLLVKQDNENAKNLYTKLGYREYCYDEPVHIFTKKL